MNTARAEIMTRETELLKLFLTLLKQDQVNTVSETEPYGTLIAIEDKHNETRTWPARLSYNGPYYTGPLAIHLAKKMDDAVCYREPFSSALRAAGYKPNIERNNNTWGLPLGHIIGVAWLNRIWQVNDHTKHLVPNEGSKERTFGNYSEGRFIWTFSRAYRLRLPIPVLRGAPGIWKWTPPPQFWNEIQAQTDQLRLQITQE